MLAIKKGEFESSQAFEARQKAAQDKTQENFFVTASSSPDHIRYDADRERFVISKYAWANIAPNLDTVPGLTETPINLGTNYHGLGVLTREIPLGTYRASNAYGASTEIVRLQRLTFGIFDCLSKPGERTWRLDFDKGDDVFASSLTGGLYLNVPRNAAQALKPNIRFAVEVSPRPPFVERGSRRFEPRFDRPTDITETTEIFVGKVGCLLVMDSAGTVIRAVPPGY